jgi:hypothetical protein
MRQPPVSLENISEAEKTALTEHAKKGIIRGIGFFIVPFILMIWVISYVNNHWLSLGLEDESMRGVINLGLVMLAVVPARLFVSTLLRFRKANAAWQKKVIRGPVTSKNGNTIIVANQKIKLNAGLAAKVNEGANVVVEMSTNTDYVFSVETTAAAN